MRKRVGGGIVAIDVSKASGRLPSGAWRSNRGRGALEVDRRFIPSTQLLEQARPVEERLGVIGPQAQHLFVSGERFVAALQPEKRRGTVVAGVDVIGAQFHRALVSRERFVPALEALQDVAAIAPCERVARLDAEQLVIGRERFRPAPEIAQRERKIEECIPVAGADRQRAVKRFEGLGGTAQCPQCHAAIAVGIGEAGLQVDGAREMRKGARRIAALERDRAEQIDRVEGTGRGLEDEASEALGLVDPVRLVERDRPLQCLGDRQPRQDVRKRRGR